MGRRKKRINTTGIPDYKIEAIARVLWPDILADWKDEQVQKEFAEWLKQQEYEENSKMKNIKNIA